MKKNQNKLQKIISKISIYLFNNKDCKQFFLLRSELPHKKHWLAAYTTLFYAFFFILSIPLANAIPERANAVSTGHVYTPASHLVMQGGSLTETGCKSCHKDQFEQWRGSMMAYASKSPVFSALEKVENRRQGSELTPLNDMNKVHGRLARTPNNSGTEDQFPCQKCHSPIGVATDMFPDYSLYDEANSDDELDSREVLEKLKNSGLNYFGDGRPRTDANLKASLEGVTCVACHRITGPDATARTGFEPGIANNAYMIDGNTTTNFGPYEQFGIDNNLFFASLTQTGEHSIGYSVLRTDQNGIIVGNAAANNNVTGNEQLYHGEDGIQRPYIQTGEFCGSCHDVRLPNQDGVTVRRLENLFTEWRDSPWNNNDNDTNTDGVPDSLVTDSQGVPRGLKSAFDNPRDYAILPSGANVMGIDSKPVKSVTSCQDCHMTSYMRDPMASPGIYDFGPRSYVYNTNIPNQSARISDHSFVGVDKELVPYGGVGPSTKQQEYREVLLQKAVDMKLVSAEVNNENKLEISLSLTNIGAGHNVPAGFSQERQVWVDLEVIDSGGGKVFRSGYLVDHSSEHVDCDNPINEWRCDLDDIAEDTVINTRLEITSGNGYLEPGADTQLLNFQNEFKRNGQRILNPFISDQTDNEHALKPFVERIKTYTTDSLNGFRPPFTVSAKLRFRPFPYEFLQALSHSSNRITESVMKRNTIVEMENDTCTTQLNPRTNLRLCSSSASPFALGKNHACLLADGKLSCWGDGSRGKLGDGSTGSHIVSTMTPVNSFPNNLKQVAVGDEHSCYLTLAGQVSCWGVGTDQRLGNSGSADRATPALVNDLPAAESIALGYNHSCAIIGANRNVMCWGKNDQGQLGNFSTSTSGTPSVAVFLSSVKQLALGKSFSCAIQGDGSVWCWGKNDKGQLGKGDTSGSTYPIPVMLDYPAVSISAGSEHACALLVSGTVMCWGNGIDGRLGDEVTIAHTALVPAKVHIVENAIRISAGYEHTCIKSSNGQSYCAGKNATHYGTSGFTVFTGFGQIKDIEAGNGFTCATLSEGGMQCYGEGSTGQLGSGLSVDTAFPVDVIWPQTVIEYTAENPQLDFVNVGTQPWLRDKDGTPSSSTGPTSGANGSTYYYYFETSSSAGNAGQTASLLTDLFDPSSSALSFNYHMYGSAIGELKVEVLANDEVVDTVWIRSGNQGNQWLTTGDIDLSAFEIYGQIQLRIINTAAGGAYSYRGDTALDNIRVIRQ